MEFEGHDRTVIIKMFFQLVPNSLSLNTNGFLSHFYFPGRKMIHVTLSCEMIMNISIQHKHVIKHNRQQRMFELEDKDHNVQQIDVAKF